MNINKRNSRQTNKKFSKLLIRDPVILSLEQWERLSEKADIVFYPFVQIDNNLKKNKIENLIPIKKTEIPKFLKDCDGIITCWTKISNEIISTNTNIRYIGFWTHCLEEKIDTELAEKAGITVTFIPDYATEAVAEMVFAGILSIQRRIKEISKNTLKGKWAYEYLKTGSHIPKVESINTYLMSNKILGIVGFGKVGQRVAEIATAFKMKLQYFSTSRHMDWENRGVRYSDIGNLFSTSDIISLHLPQNAPIEMINKELIQLMKNNTILINTSIGKIIDEEALFDWILKRNIFVYLDVYKSLPNRKKLQQLEITKNIFTYRASWFTQESILSKGECLIKNIENYFGG